MHPIPSYLLVFLLQFLMLYSTVHACDPERPKIDLWKLIKVVIDLFLQLILFACLSQSVAVCSEHSMN